MKIAYIFSYLGDGGAEDNAILLAKKAKESGNKPIFIVGKYSESAIKKIDEFEKIVLPMDSSVNPIKVLGSIHRLKKMIKTENIDIVHAHMLREHSLAMLTKMFGSKFVLIRTFHRFDQFNWKMEPLMPLYRKYTDKVIAVSDLLAKTLEKNGWGKLCETIENGVEKVQVNKHQSALGFIGRLTEGKGILQFVRANKGILKKTKLVIAGDGPQYVKIKQFIQENDLQVQLLGNLQNKADFYEKVSVLILPSDAEVMPLVILEAYSCGMPVVAFDIEPLRGLVEPENGYLVNFPDYELMGKKSVEIMGHAENYAAANLCIYDEQYSADVMWGKYSSLYEALYRK